MGRTPGREWWGRVDQLPTQVVAQGTRTVGEVTTIVENPNHDLLPGVTVNVTVVSAVVKDAPCHPESGAAHPARNFRRVPLVGQNSCVDAREAWCKRCK